MNHPGIYAIKNLVSKTVYVGSSHCVEKRREQHRTALEEDTHHNAHLQNAWNKYGPNAFVFQLLERIEDQRRLLQREQAWLERFRRSGPVYNIVKHLDCKRDAALQAEKQEKARLFEQEWRRNALKLYAIMKATVSDQDWACITARAIKDALHGDREANRWIEDYVPYYRNLVVE